MHYSFLRRGFGALARLCETTRAGVACDLARLRWRRGLVWSGIALAAPQSAGTLGSYPSGFSVS